MHVVGNEVLIPRQKHSKNIYKLNVSYQKRPSIRGYGLFHILCTFPFLRSFHYRSILNITFSNSYQMGNQRSPNISSQKSQTKPSDPTINRKVTADQISSVYLQSVLSVCLQWVCVCDAVGCVLLNLLLQQPLDPSTLGLCHLLSISPAALPNVLSQNGYVSSWVSTRHHIQHT